MDWNVKNAVNRDVERQHLNKILKEIRATTDELSASISEESGLDGEVRNIVVGLVENNTEHGITVIYNSDGEVLDFIVNDFTIRLSGDVTGEADVVGLRDVNITATIDPALIGVPEAPIDGFPYWRYGGEWQQVTGGLHQLEELITNGFTVKIYDSGSGEHSWVIRQINVNAGELTVDDGDGVSGNPTLGLADVTPVAGGTFLLTEFDAKGRRIEEQAGTAADVPYDNATSGLTATDVQAAIDEVVAESTNGTVTSVAVADATGITWSGSPITTSGTFTPTLSTNLQAWSGIATSEKLDTSAYNAADVLAKILTVDGPGSGLNADQLEGLHGASTATANTVATRDASGDIQARLFRPAFADGASISGAIAFRINNTTDNYIRFCSDKSAIRAYLECYSGTYTPTLTAVANVDASVAYQCQYSRVGNVVTVSGRVDIDPTAAVLTQLRMSLPIPSNLSAGNNLGGVASSVSQSCRIIADAVNDAAQIEYTAISTGNAGYWFTFQYLII